MEPKVVQADGAPAASPTPLATEPAAPEPTPLSALRAIERKLERWELQHLREHAAQQALRLESLQTELDAARDAADDAEQRAEWWREQVMQLHEDLADDLAIGLGKDGAMGLVKSPPDEARPAVPTKGATS